MLLSIPQFVLQMSVIYFIFRAFGYHDVSYLEVLAVQSMLQVSVSFMPMPGASGAQEIGFLPSSATILSTTTSMPL